MTEIPDPLSSSEKGAVATTLEAGLAALKQGNYPAAIAYLEDVCQTHRVAVETPSTSTLIRAQMGLVTAYSKIGAAEQAITLCQTLNQSTNPQVKSWAERHLADLAKRYPHTQITPDPSFHTPHPVTETSAVTGFVPLNQPSTPSENASGFVPLNQTSTPSEKASGFVPLNQTEQSPAEPPATSTQGRRESHPPRLDSPNRNRIHQSDSRLPEGSSITPIESDSSANSRASEMAGGNDDAPVESLTPIVSFNIPTTPSEREWHHAGRAKTWKPLQAVQQERLWLVQAGTALVVFWLIRCLVQLFMDTTNNTLVNIPFLRPIPAFYNDPTQTILIGLEILFCLSPWLMDAFLKGCYGCQSLSLPTLSKYSPETSRMLPRICQQQRVRVPSLRVLPTSAPIALTYGNLPLTARIVVSQGLLDQLADDEIATIYATQLGHITRYRRVGLVIAAVLGFIGGFFNLFGNSDWAWNCWWLALICLPMGLDLAVISWVLLLAQLPYTLYRFVSQWGDTTQNPFLRTTAGIISALSYGLFWLIRYLALWLSRLRVYFSDRFCADITGNPNGLTRALLKMNLGIAQDIQKHGSTSWVLESFDLLMPIGYTSAISLGSLPSHIPFEAVLQWDRLNPSRQWLVINNSHPLIGDRLQLLSLYARHWKLDTELDFETHQPSVPSKNQNQMSKLKNLQAAPFLGILLSLAFGCLLWIIAWVDDNWIRIRLLSWILDDFGVLLVGCCLMGFSIGTFVRINAFFPDIKPGKLRTDPNLPELYANPAALPVDSQPVSLSGKLLGRRGISNWLGQDLILQTPTGLIKLHHFSQLGPLGNLWFKSARSSDFMNRSVTATGWFRRGATPWIDIDTLKTQGGLTSRGGHPIWSTILASMAAAWGTYIIYRGEF